MEKAEVIKEKDSQGIIEVRITDGPLKGKTYKITLTESKKGAASFKKGEDVIVQISKNPQTGQELVYITDYQRTSPLIMLFFLFLVVVFSIGRLKGFLSFVGMAFSLLIIGSFIIPQIMAGNDPVLISLLGALLIIPVTFYISHGLNRKTTIALIGTFLSLVVTAFLAFLFVYLTKLTGFAAEEAIYLQNIQNGAINIKNLLLAGIIIGALGVLDDITISQAAVVEKLNQANRNWNFKELYKHSMEVGRDHIASLVNTLVLVYTGASLPLFLLFYNTNLSPSLIVNQEIVATEIVRTLVASIGIISAVPVTTFLASYYFLKK